MYKSIKNKNSLENLCVCLEEAHTFVVKFFFMVFLVNKKTINNKVLVSCSGQKTIRVHTTVVPAGVPKKFDFFVQDTDTIGDVKSKIQAKYPACHVDLQYLSWVDSEFKDDEAMLKSLAISASDTDYEIMLMVVLKVHVKVENENENAEFTFANDYEGGEKIQGLKSSFESKWHAHQSDDTTPRFLVAGDKLLDERRTLKQCDIGPKTTLRGNTTIIKTLFFFVADQFFFFFLCFLFQKKEIFVVGYFFPRPIFFFFW